MTPIPAATVVLLRPGRDGPEVLLTHRPTTMAFAADLHVFPGGRVDGEDGDARLAARSTRTATDAARILGDNVSPAEAHALHVAAIRELYEEAGVLLADGTIDAKAHTLGRDRLLAGEGIGAVAADLDVRLRTDLLVPIAHWTTPPFMPRRFATWFFVADLPDGVVPTFVGGEVIGHRWLAATAALDQMAAGEIGMWVPTSSVLQRLAQSGAASAADIAERLGFAPIGPPRVIDESAERVRIESDMAGGLPGRVAIAEIRGRRTLVVVDPGDPSEAAIAAIRSVAARRRGQIAAIVLTAPDPDHAAGAEMLAIPLEIPVLVAPGAGRHLPYETRVLADGDPLPTDIGLTVRLGPIGSGQLEVVPASAGK